MSTVEHSRMPSSSSSCGDESPRSPSDSPTDSKSSNKAKSPEVSNGEDRANRFAGSGLDFKAKLIGVEDVPEARGDKMCQVAMAKLKAAVKATKEHKQKIVVNVSLTGLKIIDEKSSEVIHNHEVQRISFISRDTTDSRAFGYVCRRTEGSYQFFGIKTDKAAESLVLSLRDLFQVVFDMRKKKQVENETPGNTDKESQPEEEKQEKKEEESKTDDEKMSAVEENLLNLDFEAPSISEAKLTTQLANGGSSMWGSIDPWTGGPANGTAGVTVHPNPFYPPTVATHSTFFAQMIPQAQMTTGSLFSISPFSAAAPAPGISMTTRPVVQSAWQSPPAGVHVHPHGVVIPTWPPVVAAGTTGTTAAIVDPFHSPTAPGPPAPPPLVQRPPTVAAGPPKIPAPPLIPARVGVSPQSPGNPFKAGGDPPSGGVAGSSWETMDPFADLAMLSTKPASGAVARKTDKKDFFPDESKPPTLIDLSVLQQQQPNNSTELDLFGATPFSTRAVIAKDDPFA